MEYKVLKVLNNNAILLEKQNDVYIGMGSGIGFGKKNGSMMSRDEIPKLFEDSSNQFMSKLSSSISKLEENLYPLVDRIVQHVEKQLNIDVTDQLYLALAEHIGFAKTRLSKGLVVPCPMEHEIKLLYPNEYAVAKDAVKIIEEDMKLKFPVNEAGFISLHIINAANASPKEEVMNQFELVLDIVEIIEQHYSKKIEESSLAYARLLTHLNFLGKRIFLSEGNSEITNTTQNIFFNSNCVDAIACSDKIKKHISKQYSFELSVDEVNYLIIHIQNCMGSI